jgi:hypothetical protein
VVDLKITKASEDKMETTTKMTNTENNQTVEFLEHLRVYSIYLGAITLRFHI